MKENKQITIGSSDSTTVAADFKYSMQGKVISITYLGAGSIHEELGRYSGGLSTCTRALLRLQDPTPGR